MILKFRRFFPMLDHMIKCLLPNRIYKIFRTVTVTVDEDEPRDILEEAARQIDDPDGQERTQQEQHHEIGGQPSYIRVTPNSISVKKTKVSSQSKKRTRSGSKKKS